MFFLQEIDVYKVHNESETHENLIKSIICKPHGLETDLIILNMCDILPASIPHAATLIDTCHAALSHYHPSSWLSGDIVRRLGQILLGEALENISKDVTLDRILDKVIPFIPSITSDEASKVQSDPIITEELALCVADIVIYQTCQ